MIILVYVPAHPRVTDYGKDIGVELRGTDDGELVGIAFSSLERLVAALGEYQPWVVMERDRFTAFVGAAGADFATRHPKQARLCKRHPTGQAYRYQLGPIRKTIPALDEAFRSVRPELYRGVREQSWAETPGWGYRVR